MDTKGSNKLTDESVSEIDRALNAAKARKASREGSTKTGGTAATEPKAAKPKATEAEKAAKKAEADAARATKKAERLAARDERRAQRNASRKPAHLAKVMRAAERLSPLGQAAQLLFSEATSSLAAVDLANLALHIQHHNRKAATERALGQKLEAGMQVTIVGGDPRFIGKTGTVVKAQRIRCYIDVPGNKKSIYLFTSDVSPVTADASHASAG